MMRGLEEVMDNLNRKIAAAGKATELGLYQAGLIIERESMERTPVDTGNLKNSAFVDQDGKKVVVGYTAEYAPAVHENLEAHHPIGEAKFLENAANAKGKEALKAVQDSITESMK